MSMDVFEDGGALLANSPVYVARAADNQALRHLQRMEYITLVEPRQQGKTSLVNSLVEHKRADGYVFAYADMTTFDRSSESTWYESFCTWILVQLAFLDSERYPKLPVNGNSWRNFLLHLAVTAEKANLKLVVAIDEVGAIPADFATDFFSAIRGVFNSRQTMACFRQLSFIIAGAYNPKELIQDRSISNFNIDHRIPIGDFGTPELRQLVQHLVIDETQEVTERLLYWTGGQPFLCQRLCRYLASEASHGAAEAVDAAVERFFREDTNHLSRILGDLRAEPKLLDYALEITAKSVKFTPSINDWQFRLAHVIGIIAPDSNGCCSIRNRMYVRALQSGAFVENSAPASCVQRNARLSGSQVQRIKEAIVGGYDLDELRSMVRTHLDESLSHLVGGGPLDTQVFALIEWAERTGRVLELVRAATTANPANETLRALWSELQP